MNYLAHLYLAQPNADSHFGNLLGDFRRGLVHQQWPKAVQLGLENHLLVDRFTDQHSSVRCAVSLFSPQRRRFAPVALDVLFDHLLIRHWQDFTSTEFDEFCRQSYQLLNTRSDLMPARMRHVVGKMSEQDWFATYAELDGVALALDRIATRIRFRNDFAGAIEDIERHFDAFEAHFLAFFPELITHVQTHNIELASMDANASPTPLKLTDIK
ncbi:acyl carrier protein phosphodiesterase [Pseudoalteromonas sp. T1lg48]|uniref:acyl carrier protein phosphodiesterase n=1 Tax=Pseudoalteromonas sp. T1lg48 TaxID=2077100 RepID=UPI000CF670DA|nr:ACP phosphodiesterase [Pseudoalteromonas sp. T1lg48]